MENVTMGLDAAALTIIGAMSKFGRIHGTVATLGRANTFFGTRHFRRVAAQFELDISSLECRALASERFVEPLLKRLGAKTVESIDSSAYEGASIITDLNRPVGEHLTEEFDFLYDGGTIEHVYNVPSAIENSAKLLKSGAFFVADNTANNESGHGFYQFSPEFYYRVFPYHGLEILRCYLTTNRAPSQWYRVDDPHSVHGRITYLSAEPIHVFVIARKSGLRQQFKAGVPMQSDYESGHWETGTDALTWDRSLLAKLRRLLNRTMLRVLWPICVVSRSMFGIGPAIWATSSGIHRVNIFEDLRKLGHELGHSAHAVVEPSLQDHHDRPLASRS
jgi:hypothetical protein